MPVSPNYSIVRKHNHSPLAVVSVKLAASDLISKKQIVGGSATAMSDLKGHS